MWDHAHDMHPKTWRLNAASEMADRFAVGESLGDVPFSLRLSSSSSMATPNDYIALDIQLDIPAIPSQEGHLD